MDMQGWSEGDRHEAVFLFKESLTLNPFSVCVYLCIFLTEVKWLIPVIIGCIKYYENSRL